MIDFSLIYRTINGVIDYHPRPNYMMSIVAFDINATIAQSYLKKKEKDFV